MKFKKDTILQIGNEFIYHKDVRKIRLIESICKNNEASLQKLKIEVNNLNYKLNIDLKNRNLYVIIEGEKILVKLLTIPKVNNNLIYETIKNELKYNLFDVHNIVFNYKIIKTYKDKYEVLTFCVRANKINLLKNYISRKNNISRINLIQFCILSFLKDEIKEKDFLLAVKFNNNYYFVMCLNNNLVANQTFNIKDCKSDNLNNIINELTKFIQDNREIYKGVKILYCSNIECFDMLYEFVNIPVVKVSELKNEKIIDYYFKNLR